MQELLSQIRSCTHRSSHLPLGTRLVSRVSPSSKILVVGQAPATKVHASGIPWDDKGGKELRTWLDADVFYKTDNFGIMPMGCATQERERAVTFHPEQNVPHLAGTSLGYVASAQIGYTYNSRCPEVLTTKRNGANTYSHSPEFRSLSTIRR